MTKLRISPDLSLPLDAVTQRLAFLGKPGSGKSYAATKLAELMHDAGAQFVALDPVGIWYGLRLDGSGKGLAVPVFGGLHGDVPLTPTSGAMIADLIVDRRLSCVLDTSQFEHDTDKARFAAGFASRFYFRMKAAPAAVHVFLEECQEWVPQNPQRGEEQMLHDFTRMDKLGRNFGIGLSLITQRPQEVNKKVLNLTECLFAFQMTGAHERKAIRDWVTTVGADENILTVLPTLAIAHAHVYSPQWLRISQQVKVGEKRTADVSSTPAVGVSKVAEKPLTPVDLGKIREAMTETIEKAKADDPKELRKEIARLNTQVKRLSEQAPAKVVDDRAIADAFAAGRNDERLKLREWFSSHTVGLAGLKIELNTVARVFAEAYQKSESMLRVLETAGDSRAAVQVGNHGVAGKAGNATGRTAANNGRQSSPSEGRRLPSRSTPRAPAAPSSGESLPPAQQGILNALAELEALGVDRPSREQASVVASRNLIGGGGGQHIADLVDAGLVEIPGKGAIRLTAAGRARAVADTPSTLDELHDRLLNKLVPAQRDIMAHLLSIYPDAISRDELGAAVKRNLVGGGGGQHVADLVARGVAKLPGSGKVVASDMLFPEALV